MVGKLKLKWDEKRHCWLYDDFNQNIDDLKDVEEEGLSFGLWEEIFEKKIKEVENEIHKPPKLFRTHEELVEHLNRRYEKLGSWEK